MENFSVDSSQVKPPSLFWLATEIGRALTEFGVSYPFRTIAKRNKTGDGHPVLVLPGFMASDVSTKPLRRFLINIGYSAYGWRLGRNYGELAYLKSISFLIDEISDRYGQKVSLIGWSLGGVYARQLAKAHPGLIRQVITLGSPFGALDQPNHATWVYKIISNGKSAKDLCPLLLEDLPKPAPIPTTAIYTKEDGIVPWKACLEKEETEIHQNIQVRGSHLGLGVNSTVLSIIANRLQYRQENWVQFRHRGKG